MTPGNQNPELPSEVQQEKDISSADAAERLEQSPEEQENRKDVPEDNHLREENVRTEGS